jgi:hypothetical protein
MHQNSLVKPKRLFFMQMALLLAFVPGAAFADALAYDATVNLDVATPLLRAKHIHDGTRGLAWTVSLEDKFTGRVTSIAKVPALTYLWISKNSNYIVGLSNVMLKNPFQLLVFSKSGERLLELDMRSFLWTDRMQSITNWIHWYKEPDPELSLDENGHTCTLGVTDAHGTRRHFEFGCALNG